MISKSIKDNMANYKIMQIYKRLKEIKYNINERVSTMLHNLGGVTKELKGWKDELKYQNPYLSRGIVD